MPVNLSWKIEQQHQQQYVQKSIEMDEKKIKYHKKKNAFMLEPFDGYIAKDHSNCNGNVKANNQRYWFNDM